MRVINAASLQTGEILAGKFCIERIIATGGVGVVVAARHLQLGETVALKFLIPQADRDATDVVRFVREAQSAVKLKNEHVARVLDVGSLEDGAPYMVMEYLEGSDLDQVLRHRGPLSIHDAVDYILQACEAIAEAHQLGIVHRDLKPSNFFLARRTDGSPLIKVLDFGIAKARAEMQQDVSLTKTRTVLGSPVYMSPEQIRSARSVDHRTDIWSLGVTLYELLSDQLPFDGDSITGVAAAVSSDAIAPIRSLRPEIPAGLSAIVEKCLEKKPDDRYQTVAEFAAALAPYGPESAAYSLTRIRGAAGLRASDPGTQTLARATEIGPLISPPPDPELTLIGRRLRRRRLLIAAGVIALVVTMTLPLLFRKGVNRGRASNSADVLSPDVSVHSGRIPGRSSAVPGILESQARENVVVAGSPAAINTTAVLPAVPSVTAAAAASSVNSRKPPIPRAANKPLVQRGIQTRDSSGEAKYESIFETRK